MGGVCPSQQTHGTHTPNVRRESMAFGACGASCYAGAGAT